MKTLYAAGTLGTFALGTIGALGLAIAMVLVILIPGGSLIALAIHLRHKKQVQEPRLLEKKISNQAVAA